MRQSFFGMVHIYGRFFKHMATAEKPLTLLTGNIDFPEEHCHESCLASLKAQVMNALALRECHPEVPKVLLGNASGCADGAVLELDDGKGRQPVAIFSQTPNIHEQWCTSRDPELPAIVQAFRQWQS